MVAQPSSRGLHYVYIKAPGKANKPGSPEEEVAAGLKELYRILRPGARAGVLDFNHLVKGSIRDIFQKFYLRKLVVPIASRMGLREQYAYLEESLKNFPSGQLQESMAKRAGFKKTSYKLLAGGQMGVLLLN